MLHRIKPPSKDYVLFECLQFQFYLLEFACTPEYSQPLTEDTIRDSFQEEYIADYLCARIRIDEKGRATGKLATSINALAAYMRKNPGEKERVLEAYKHDIDFYEHLNDENFTFAYFDLCEETQDKVKPLMEYCYDLLQSPGLPLRPTSPTVKKRKPKITRQRLVDEFWKRNEDVLSVCACCDGPSHRITLKKAYGHADHFFPRSKYPFLSIHPYNLVPICTICNSFFKIDKDPLENHKHETLLDTYHPYVRPAIDSIEVEFYKVARGASELSLKDKEARAGCLSKRLKNLDRVLGLKETWSGNYMDKVVDNLVNDIRGYGEFLGDRELYTVRIKSEVEKSLKRIEAERRKRLGKEYYYILKFYYAHYAITHDGELENLVKEFLRRKEAEKAKEKKVESKVDPWRANLVRLAPPKKPR